MLRPAVFLDRDGTINVEVNYLHRADDVELIPGVGQAIAQLNRAGLLVVVVTNQAGIARGFYDVSDVAAVHAHMTMLLQQHGAQIDGWYFCPHHPDFTPACSCRKPLPGMLLQAASDLKIDLRASWMIGDTQGDIEAGKAAGCRSILVRTGYGEKTALELEKQGVLEIVADLPAAVGVILGGVGSGQNAQPQP
ncbi:MAG: D-glycero-beta-D-manno-heptose 1,7-bisphosphate 7-phosphatase [Herpetosiphonaceae bacterium]|nr:D-glycero-beta-D-manno-heptose 1,7-bisphosphate 7-phosphatase [Herpetosiphonaceae bacterium]